MGDSALVSDPFEHVEISATSQSCVVDVHGLEKRYKKTIAVRGAGFSVQRGEIFGLIGPDGSGKSSLIRAIAGVQRYDAGSVKVFGQLVDSERSAERVKDRIGLMPQGLGNNLYAQLSIEENINYFAGLRLVDRRALKQRKERLLGMTRLIEFRDRPMKQLSGGMKQKLGLVCTLIHQPELVLLDEPTTGVDPVSRRDFWAIVTELVHELGMTAIVSTAYMDEAAYMNRLALMMDGRIVSQGTEEDIESLVPGTVVSFEKPNGSEAVFQPSATLPHVQTMGNMVRVFVPGKQEREAAEAVARLVGIDCAGMTLSSAGLEDVLACLLSKRTPNEDAHSQPIQAEQVAASVNNNRRETANARDSLPPIRARNLVQDFGKFRAVNHVSFDVEAGGIFGLLGANGAGKTTVIKMLTGLLPPTSGWGSVAGADVNHAGHAIKERIGYMSQSFSLYTDMTAMENLEFYAGVYGLFPRMRRVRIAEVISLVGLEGYERRLSSDLPVGIRQRLALGCALVHRPEVIFLDEPTSGVDVLGRRQFWDTLLRLAREECVAILVTTHYMTEAEHCDDLALMYAGRVVASGAPSVLRTQLEDQVGRPLNVLTTAPLRSLHLAREAGFDRAALFGRSLRVLTKHIEADQNRLRDVLAADNIQVVDAQAESATMEDVFVHSVLAEESVQAHGDVSTPESIARTSGGSNANDHLECARPAEKGQSEARSKP